MIKNLQVFNFQSHKETHLDFHDGINILIGKSDSGKTALFRALDWVTNNRPTGDAFRSSWGGETRVILDTSEHMINRWKSKTTENGYALLDKAKAEDEGGGCTEFKAFGQSVPEEILEAINMEQINFQRQLDSPFLLSESPGEVARQLNDVVNLNVIDSSLVNILKKIRRAHQDKQSKESQLEELKAEMSSFSYLGKMERDIKSLENIDADLYEISEDIEWMERTIRSCTDKEQDLKAARSIISIEKKLEHLESISCQIEDLDKDTSELRVLGSRISNQQKELEDAEKLLPAESKLAKLESITEQLGELIWNIDSMTDIGQQIRDKKNQLERAISQLEKAEEEFHELMPDECPLCGK